MAWQWQVQDHIDGLVQDCSISSVLAMEILQSCTKPSISYMSHYEPIKDTSYLALMGKLWSVVCECFGENVLKRFKCVISILYILLSTELLYLLCDSCGDTASIKLFISCYTCCMTQKESDIILSYLTTPWPPLLSSPASVVPHKAHCRWGQHQNWSQPQHV